MRRSPDTPRVPETVAAGRRDAEPSPQPVTFTFQGRTLRGTAGETIARALFRNGIRTLSRSVKYARPRGIHCGRGRCSMCAVEVNGVPSVKACNTPLEDGMRIRRQDYRPFYARVLVEAVRRIPFPAGFYFRYFTGPKFVRRMFLGTLREMAGVAKVDEEPSATSPPSHSVGAMGGTSPLEGLQSEYDVVVVGAGLSGMAAALAAADQGASVLLVDEYARPGGHSLGVQHDAALAEQRNVLAERIASHQSVTSCMETLAQGFYPPNTLVLAHHSAGAPGRVKRVAARSFVFATGAYDLVPLFENNDMPGIFGARAIRLFLERDNLIPGRKAVVYGAGNPVQDTVALLQARGVKVAAVATVDAGDPLSARDEAMGLLRFARMKAAKGNEWLSGVLVEHGSSGTGPRREIPIDCDILCVALPGQPAFELPQQAGFGFAMSDHPVEDARGMIIVNDRLDPDDGVGRYVTGDAAGRTEWREKLAHADLIGKAACP